MLRVRFGDSPNVKNLVAVIERLRDEAFYDPTAKAFKVQPAGSAVGSVPLAEDPARPGVYVVRLDTPPTVWTDGDYFVSVHPLIGATLGPQCGVAQAQVVAGDDATPIPLTKLPSRATIIFDPQPAGTAIGGH